MPGTVLSLTVLGAGSLAVILAVDWKKSLRHLALLALFLAILYADNLIIVAANQNPHLQIIPNGSWGTVLLLWSGKLYSVLAGLIVALLIRPVISLQQLGLTLKQKEGSILPGLGGLAAASIAAILIGSGWEKGPFDPVVLIYMLIVPGLNEELVYRGLLLGILDHIKPPEWNLLGAKIGWGAVIMALLFGLLHGFWVEADFSFHIQGFPILFSSINGLLFAWQKARTGSLLMPFLTHGAFDFAIELVRMV